MQSINELLGEGEIAQVSDSELDDAVWLSLCEKISTPKDLLAFPDVVGTYYASRYVEWEVGNGGFAQAVLNVPEWLGPAAAAFKALGKPMVTDIIVEAQEIVRREISALPEVRPGAEQALSDYFYDNAFNHLDAQLDDIGFWSDDRRVALVRENREQFLEACTRVT